MAEMAAFPALARAKKLFLLRKHASTRREREGNAGSNAIRRREVLSSNTPERDQERQEPARALGSEAARRCTASLVAFCSDFDEQLRLMNSDIVLLNTSVRREYQRESLALDKLTSELLNGEVHGVKTPPTHRSDVQRCHVRLRTRKPRIKLRVVLPSPLKLSAPKQPLTSPKTLSRAALLAYQAVKACVLQTYTRFYLYRCLYLGGPGQLVAVGRLASRCRRSRAFRQWRRVVTQRIKLRLRCRRAQQHIERCAASWARDRAFEIVESAGKYAMAKEFHQSKLQARSFHTWLNWYQTDAACLV